MSDRPNQDVSPLMLGLIVAAVACGFATMLWVGARAEVAAIYGTIRSIQVPGLQQFTPHGWEFASEARAHGHAPAFEAIYRNSIPYGIAFTVATMGVMFLAMTKLDRHGIHRIVGVSSTRGRTVDEVLDRYGTTEPHVAFFRHFDLLDLPITHGTGRQSFTALETLIHADALEAVVVDPQGGEPPDIRIDRERMKSWYARRFGPANPLLEMEASGLNDAGRIRAAVAKLSWPTVLLLYPALRRIHAYHVEGEKGFASERDDVDAFIDGVWEELNGLAREFGDGIALGYADPWDRVERCARHAEKKHRGKRRADRPELRGSSAVEPPGPFDAVWQAGRAERGQVEDMPPIQPAPAGPRPGAVAEKRGRTRPLRFFGEVLSERGPQLRSVERARDGLVTLLTRHLSVETGRFPVDEDPQSGVVRFMDDIRSVQEQAFNHATQERLARAARVSARIVTGHSHEFGVVGSALEEARRSGIMPPSSFRYLRFCDETRPLWWFVHNLGMPAAVPEAAGAFEHYRAERRTGIALSTPCIESAVAGLHTEARKYLVPEEVGAAAGPPNATSSLSQDRSPPPSARERECAQGIPSLDELLAIVGGRPGSDAEHDEPAHLGHLVGAGDAPMDGSEDGGEGDRVDPVRDGNLRA